VSASGGKTAVVAALAANAGIALAKLVGFAVTGSSAMLAEAVHSLADTSNQGLLLFGRRRARRKADALHQFGYGRARFFYAFVVALVIFSIGAVFAIYEGVHKISAHEPLSHPLVAVVLLLVAVALEACSFVTALRESAPLRAGQSWWSYIRAARDPELPVVLLEDAGALIGLAFALVGVGMSALTGDSVWDGVASLAIGLLLAAIALVLIVETQSLLLGEGATEADTDLIRRALVDGERIDRVIHLRTQYLAPDDLLVAAKIGIAPCLSIEAIAAAIDAAESRIRAAVPTARTIYLEPDLYRS
jgi:cation diffusion facilitator family transporter